MAKDRTRHARRREPERVDLSCFAQEIGDIGCSFADVAEVVPYLAKEYWRLNRVAYSDYGAFVYLNGKRREDKEDVGVYDTDEASLPTGLRVYASIIKRAGVNDKWFTFLHHGVLGDGNVRVGCYKQGWPELYEREDGKDELTLYTFDYLSIKFGWDDYREYNGKRYPLYEYDKEFDFLGWHFRFRGDDNGGTPKYWATMIRDGEIWDCSYDYMFGAGFDGTD